MWCLEYEEPVLVGGHLFLNSHRYVLKGLTSRNDYSLALKASIALLKSLRAKKLETGECIDKAELVWRKVLS